MEVFVVLVVKRNAKKWRLGFFCFARYLSASLFYLEEQRVLADEDLYFSRRS
jgi:hypothetical protein